jgi:hypothetical protein
LAVAASSALLLGAAAGAHAAQSPSAAPGTTYGSFDTLHPFRGVKTGDEYVAKFVAGKPNIVPGDPYGNMSGAQFWNQSWFGQNINHPERTMAAHKGDGGFGVLIKSPYPFKTAEEHFNAWRAAAGGGQKLTQAQLPDWSGDWLGASQGVISSRAKVSDAMAAMSEAYKPRFQRLLVAEWIGHPWWASPFCVPVGGPAFWAQPAGGVYHFMPDRKMVLVLKDKNISDTRYIYTDDRGFLPSDKAVPQWYGESQGFWDGDELVVWSKSFKRWIFSHGLGEYSDKMQTVERYKRIGDQFVVDITLYDPEAFAYPWHDVALFQPVKDWTLRPMMFLDCPSTNNVYINKYGELDERTPNEAGWVDLTDERPWETAYKLWDQYHDPKTGLLKPGVGQ